MAKGSSRAASRNDADRQPQQAPGLRLPQQRDLRRHPLRLGLRPARRRAQGERPPPVVAGDGAAPRRRRRPRLRGDPGPRGVGGLRPRRHVHRPADRVPVLPQAVPGRPPRGGVRGEEGHAAAERPAGRQLPQLRHQGRVHRAAAVQRPAEDLPRPGGERGGPALPAARDRAGHLRQLPQRDDLGAQEAAVRHRADRQVVPQRDHAGQLHLPHPRVRADGDGVLRRAGHRRGVARVLAAGALELVHRPRACARRTCASSSTRRRSCRTTRSAPSTSSTASTSAARSSTSSRASPTAPTST